MHICNSKLIELYQIRLYFLCGTVSNQADDIYLADLALCHLILDEGGHPL